MAPVGQLHRRRGHGAFAVVFVPGENHQLLFTALGFHPPEGDAVGNSPVQVLLFPDGNRSGDKRQRSRGPEHVHLGKDTADSDIRRLSRFHLRHHGVEGHPRGPESGIVKGVQGIGHRLIGVEGADNVPLPEQGAKAHIVGIGVEALVIADHSPGLPGQKIYPEQRPRRHTHHGIHRNSRLQEGVQNTGGVHSPHASPFQGHSHFHLKNLPFREISPNRMFLAYTFALEKARAEKSAGNPSVLFAKSVAFAEFPEPILFYRIIP